MEAAQGHLAWHSMGEGWLMSSSGFLLADDNNNDFMTKMFFDTVNTFYCYIFFWLFFSSHFRLTAIRVSYLKYYSFIIFS